MASYSYQKLVKLRQDFPTRNSDLEVIMTFILHRIVTAIVCSASILTATARAAEPRNPPSNHIMQQRIYLGKTLLVEAASDIAGATYILTVRLESGKPMNSPSAIGFSVGSAYFAVPQALFKNQYAMAATTHLFKLDDEHVGFVAFCGDGERAKRCLFKINIRKFVVCREDWSPYGKLQSSSEYFPLAKSQ